MPIARSEAELLQSFAACRRTTNAGLEVAERRAPPDSLQVSVRSTGRLAPFRYFFNRPSGHLVVQ